MLPIIVWSNVEDISSENYLANLDENYTDSVESRRTCTIVWPQNQYIKIDIVFIIYSIIVSFTIPTILITILYILIVRALSKSERFRRRSSLSIKRLTKPRRKVTKRVLLLVGVIVICYTPYWINQIVLIINYTLFKYQSNFFYYISTRLSTIFQILICVNSALNPYLYGLFSEKFKNTYEKVTKSNYWKTFSYNTFNRPHELNSHNITLIKIDKIPSYRISTL